MQRLYESEVASLLPSGASQVILFQGTGSHLLDQPLKKGASTSRRPKGQSVGRFFFFWGGFKTDVFCFFSGELVVRPAEENGLHPSLRHAS